VSYERQTSEVATLRRGQMLDRKIDKMIQKEPGPLLSEEFEEVRSNSLCQNKMHGIEVSQRGVLLVQIEQELQL